MNIIIFNIIFSSSISILSKLWATLGWIFQYYNWKLYNNKKYDDDDDDDDDDNNNNNDNNK